MCCCFLLLLASPTRSSHKIGSDETERNDNNEPYRNNDNSITMEHEHTALNGTTTTTTTNKEKKKGFIPLVVFTFTGLLLVLGFYTGQMRGSSSLSGSGDTCAAPKQGCSASRCCYGDCLAIGKINVCECIPTTENVYACITNNDCCSGKCNRFNPTTLRPNSACN